MTDLAPLAMDATDDEAATHEIPTTTDDVVSRAHDFGFGVFGVAFVNYRRRGY